MIYSGSTYALLRNLNLLDDRFLKFDRPDSFEIGRKKACMLAKHYENERKYNLRSRIVSFAVYTVYKFGPPFVEVRVRRRLGST